MVEAVTFDFWNTLMCEGPSGLVDARLVAWTGILEEGGWSVPTERLRTAHQVAFEAYQQAWKRNRQFQSAEATTAILSALELSVPHRVVVALGESFAKAGDETDIRLVSGVADCLRALKGRGLGLGIVCDIGLTPSSALRHHLDRHGLLDLFDAFAFSDEVGVYKPDEHIFRHALEGMGGIAPTSVAHVGDRRRTDVAGARALGMVAVRYTGVFDDDLDLEPEASIVVHDYSDLPRKLGLFGV